ncbi:MAG: hypothetical protein WC390_07085 [Sulfurimonas sp.]|jgi:hypothetical protein
MEALAKILLMKITLDKMIERNKKDIQKIEEILSVGILNYDFDKNIIYPF